MTTITKLDIITAIATGINDQKLLYKAKIKNLYGNEDELLRFVDSLYITVHYCGLNNESELCEIRVTNDLTTVLVGQAFELTMYQDYLKNNRTNIHRFDIKIYELADPHSFDPKNIIIDIGNDLSQRKSDGKYVSGMGQNLGDLFRRAGIHGKNNQSKI